MFQCFFMSSVLHRSLTHVSTNATNSRVCLIAVLAGSSAAVGAITVTPLSALVYQVAVAVAAGEGSVVLRSVVPGGVHDAGLRTC